MTKPKPWFKYAGANLKANSAKKRAPIRFAVRRARQYAWLIRIRPLVFLAVEMGSPEAALTFERNLKRLKSPLKVVRNGGRINGAWRYIMVDPRSVDISASGLHTLPHSYQGDKKQAAWAVGTVKKSKNCVFVATHFDNTGPTSNKLNQARDTVALIRRLIASHDGSWDRVFMYVDTNDPTGKVINYLNSTPLRDAKLTTPVKKRYGTKWLSNNRWKPRRGTARKVRKGHISIDWLGSGDGRTHSSYTQYDSHKNSDHDALSAVANYKQVNGAPS